MALRTPPSWLQNGSHPAENDRLTTQAIWRTTGVVNSTDMAVSASSPAAMSVSVSSGWAAIVGTYQANMGTYMAYNDAASTLTVTTADPTNPRIDLVVATVSDAFYTGTTNTVAFNVIAGTPASSPTVPATPINSIALAKIAVGAAVGSIINANITDLRVLATTPFQENLLTVNAQTGTSYTLAATDASNLVTASNASAIAVTIPTNAAVPFAVGTQITIAQYGAGQVTISGAGGVTVVSTGATASAPALRTRYATATVIQTSANNWLVVGDIA